MDRAAAHGHLAVVQYLHEQRTEGCTPNAMNLAAGSGHLDVVMFLHQHRSEGCTFRAFIEAAWYDCEPVCHFLSDVRCQSECPTCHNQWEDTALCQLFQQEIIEREAWKWTDESQ
eukprot:gene16672-19813_t